MHTYDIVVQNVLLKETFFVVGKLLFVLGFWAAKSTHYTHISTHYTHISAHYTHISAHLQTYTSINSHTRVQPIIKFVKLVNTRKKKDGSTKGIKNKGLLSFDDGEEEAWSSHSASSPNTPTHKRKSISTARHCKTLQNTAMHCTTLHHAATHWTTLQHNAPENMIDN